MGRIVRHSDDDEMRMMVEDEKSPAMQHRPRKYHRCPFHFVSWATAAVCF